MFASNFSHRDRKPKYLSKFSTKHGGDGKRWPLTPFPFLAPWPSHPPAIETPPRPVLLGPSFHDPRTHHVLESHPKQAAPLSHRDGERRHAVGFRSALALRLYLAACNPSSSCRFWVLDHLCSNWSQWFHFCWIIEIWCLNLCVCVHLIVLFCPCFSDRNKLQLWVPVCNLVVITTAIPLLLLP